MDPMNAYPVHTCNTCIECAGGWVAQPVNIIIMFLLALNKIYSDIMPFNIWGMHKKYREAFHKDI